MDRDAIEDQIGRILRSRSLADKDQLRTLLEVLFRNMDAQATLKPDRVIRELWPDEIATKRSADVATEMNRLRKALESYYLLEGQADPILISFPNRSTAGPDGGKERRWIAAEPRLVPVSKPVRPARSRHAYWLGAIIVSYFLVITLVHLWMWWHNSRPQGGRIDDTTLTIVDADGKEMWHKSFPDGFSREYYERGLATRIWFGDLDGRGRTSVLLLYQPAADTHSQSTTLICYSARGEEKWRWTPGRVLPELNGSPSVFTTVGFAVLAAPHGQRRRIVLSSRHNLYYPHQIAIVDPSGKTLSEYWHSGHLDHLALGSFGAGGREQIVAAGISNGYRQATLVVLDPDRASGASTEAARPELQLHGLGLAQERLRLLFPRSDLSQALTVYNLVDDLIVDRNRVRLSVLECELLPRCDIDYEFDRDFKLVVAVADDQLRSAHKEFYLKNGVNHPFSPQEEAEFLKVRCLEGCTSDFVPLHIQ